MKKIVLIGPRSGCGYTTAARELLKQKKTSYSNYYIKMSEFDKFRGIFSNLKMTKTSRITVPVIFVVFLDLHIRLKDVFHLQI